MLLMRCHSFSVIELDVVVWLSGVTKSIGGVVRLDSSSSGKKGDVTGSELDLACTYGIICNWGHEPFRTVGFD